MNNIKVSYMEEVCQVHIENKYANSTAGMTLMEILGGVSFQPMESNGCCIILLDVSNYLPLIGIHGVKHMVKFYTLIVTRSQDINNSQFSCL